jgi:response regulator RpfG family c-di-GMP phosphodiesterase
MVFNTEKPQPAVMSRGSGRGNRSRVESNGEENARMGGVPLTRQMLEQVIRMTQHTLKTSAASILLFRDNDQELYFEAASGPVGRTLRQVKLNTQYGIAGQVARTGKPLIVNNVGRCEKFHKLIDDTTGYSTQTLICAPLTVHHKILGVIEVLNKLDGTEFNEQDMEAAVSVAEAAAMAIDNTRLHQGMREAYRDTIAVIAAVVDARDPNNQGHSQRVAEYALLAGNNLSLSRDEAQTLEYASILHDIGKLEIETKILNQTEPLSPADLEALRRHPVIGADMVKDIPLLKAASEMILYHHEAFNGGGYPEGLKGEDIPLGARLIAVADTFDTLTTDRAGRPAMAVEEAIRELQESSSKKLCPVAVRALISGLSMYFHS